MRPVRRLPQADPADLISGSVRAAIRKQLLTWYDLHRRDLPWRRRGQDAYAQWVAEVMLQQTRVETVINYYERFLRRFPTVQALADADHDTVLKHWEGLGYYRRILHLHAAARDVRRMGSMPRSAATLRRLRGVGDYTSAAIASIAYAEPVAAVDGNVARVLARLFQVSVDVLSNRGKRLIQSIADQLIPRQRPGDFNQAWMDLGSLVCTPRAPRCGECPLRRRCTAYQNDCVDQLPVRGTNRQTAPIVHVAVAMFQAGPFMLVRKRPLGGLWSGLWEFPNVEVAGPKDCAGALGGLHGLLGIEGGDAPVHKAVVPFQLTHRRLRFHVFACSTDRRSRSTPTRKWVTAEQLGGLSISTAHQRIAKSVGFLEASSA